MTSPRHLRLVAVATLAAAACVVAAPVLAQTSTRVARRPVRIILVGDSTVAPVNGWGPGFCAGLAPEVTCVNLGKNGRSSKSYRAEGLWAEVMSALAHNEEWAATYVFIQFGHNDQPGKGDRTTDLATEFPSNMRRYAQEVRAAGAAPAFITPLTRRTFKNGKVADTLGPWADAVRKVAAEETVALLDLNQDSLAAVERMGPVEANTLALAAPPVAVAKAARTGTTIDVPKEPATEFDYTHLGDKGSTVFGRLVIAEVAAAVPALRPYMSR